MTNHLYVIDTDILNDESVFCKQYEIMTEHRKKKIDSFCFLKDKKLSLGAGILLREVFIREKILLNDADIYYNKNEKPYIKVKKDFYFNISHSGKYAVCAVSNRNIGVDIEKWQHFEEGVIEYIYLSDEIKSAALYPGSPERYYTKLWTIKESVMKYYGTGLSLEPQKITINSEDPIKVSCEEFDTSALYFKQYEIPGYFITVCSEYPVFSECIEWINI